MAASGEVKTPAALAAVSNSSPNFPSFAARHHPRTRARMPSDRELVAAWSKPALDLTPATQGGFLIELATVRGPFLPYPIAWDPR